MSWLRPGVQVPLATACTFGSLAAIVLKVLRVDQLWRPAADSGVVAAVILTFGALRLLGRTRDPHTARVRAVAWPPVIAAIVGLAVDWLLHLGLPDARLTFDGLRLSSLGPAEALAVGIFSADFGLLGSLVLAPQVCLLMRARERGDIAEVARVTRSLSLAAWGLAFAAATVALTVVREAGAAWVVEAIGSVGLAGQLLLTRRRERTAPVAAPAPYR
jgi:hypothetical protein